MMIVIKRGHVGGEQCMASVNMISGERSYFVITLDMQ